MARKLDRKVFAGARLKRLRQELGLTQTAMAIDLGISPSYLNLVERNQRPLSAQLIIKLAEVFDADVKTLAGDDDVRALGALNEVFSDPLLEDARLSVQDRVDLANENPRAAQALVTLYRAYRQVRERAAALAESAADGGALAEGQTLAFPIDEVRDFLHHHRNYFPALDEAAEAIHVEAGLGPADSFAPLAARLAERHNTSARILPVAIMGASLRRYDRHRRQLLLSEGLDYPALSFNLAIQIGLFEQAATIESYLSGGHFRSEESLGLARAALFNYFAGALLMPYGRFREAVVALRHDMVLLGRRFGASFEQVAHRLTTLQRPGDRGIPFFMIRVDTAGNVSKRFSAGGFPFAQFGGTCPRWNLHDAFRTPGQILTQLIELPDGASYLSIARTVGRPPALALGSEQPFVVGLGCVMAHAKDVVYADAFANAGEAKAQSRATPIGVTCRLCERVDCGLRAHPPLSRRIRTDQTRRSAAPFEFDLD